MKTYVAAAFTCLVLATLCFGSHLLLLALGWIPFLLRVVPRMTFDPIALAYAGASILILIVGVHVTARWLRSTIAESPRWRLSSSARLAGAFVVLFVAGTAMVGIVHQATWLVTREPTLYDPPSLNRHVARVRSANNLKTIVLGMHNYHDQNRHLPVGGTFTEQGDGLHGWTTIALWGMNVSTEGIDFQQPWHAETNRKLFQGSPGFFQNPGIHQPPHEEDGIPVSHYAGNVHALPMDAPLTLDQIPHKSQTLLIGEINANFRAWPSPYNVRDPNLGINASPHGFGGPTGQQGAQFAMADGSVRMISAKTDPQVLRQLADPFARDKPPVDGDEGSH